MYYTINNSDTKTVVIAGYVGSIKEKTKTLISVSIADKVNKNNTEWRWVSFANSDDEGIPKFYDLGKQLEVGQYVTVICSEKTSGIYTNLYVRSLEFGPKSKK